MTTTIEQTAAQLPAIGTYGNYSSNNYGAHTLMVTLPGLTVWFSYQTPVAFKAAGHEKVVRENAWGPTAGKHLNWIDGGGAAVKQRVSEDEFKRLWGERVGGFAL